MSRTSSDVYKSEPWGVFGNRNLADRLEQIRMAFSRTGYKATGIVMDENNAKQLATLLGGEIWNSGGGIWLVRKRRSDGKHMVFSDEVVSVYPDAESVESGQPEQSLIIV